MRHLYADAFIAESSSGKNGPDLILAHQPDIIFMDISMPDLDGIAATRQIREVFPEQKIIGFSMNDNDETLNRMMKAGAIGYLLKTDDLEDYRICIENALEGNTFISKNIIK